MRAPFSRLKPFTHKVYKYTEQVVLGYTATLYCLFDGDKVHCFRHESDCLENYHFCLEAGIECVMFYQDLVITPQHFPKIYTEIQDYVSQTNND